MQSLVEQISHPASKSQSSAPLSSPKESTPTHDDFVHTMDKATLTNMGVVRHYKKGDVIVEEGDLLQRMYMINSGSMSAMLNGHDVHPMDAGDSFGYVSRSFLSLVIFLYQKNHVLIEYK